MLKFYTFIHFFLCCLAFFANPISAEQAPVIPKSKSQSISLTNQQTSIIDEKLVWRSIGQHKTPLNFAAISQLYPKSNAIEGSIVGSSGAYLARIPMRNLQYLTSTWYISPNTNFVDKGLAFWEKSDGTTLKLADFSQLNDQKIPILMHAQAFSLTAEPYEQGVLWLYIEAEQFTYPLDLKVFSESSFYRHQFINNFITFMGIAVMLTLTLFSTIIFVRTRQSITLTCAAYTGLMGVGWACTSGLLDDVFSITSFNSSYSGYMLFPLAKAFACQFAKQLFNCERDFPRLARILNLLTKICLILALFMPLISFSSAYLIAHIVAMIWLPFSVVIGYIMLKQRDFRAKYYLTGNLLYTMAIIYYMLTHIELLEGILYAELLVLIALAIDCVCISLSLAEWLHLKQRDYNRNYYLARLDPLTGIKNRYSLNEELEKLTHYFVIVFIDFDGLKTINDKLGHKQGDEFLKTGAEIMRSKIKNKASIFRTGGDEFVWLYEVKHLNHIEDLVKEIPELITECEEYLQLKWAAAGISYGIATSNEKESQSECLSLADDRMYRHKRSKKDKQQDSASESTAPESI